MKRVLLAASCGLASFLMLLNAPSAAFGLAIAIQQPAPVGQRVARADATVVGTVTGIDEKTVAAPQYPGATDKAEYYVATVKVADDINGAKGLTHIKVAYLAPPKEAQPGDPRIRPIRRPIQMPPTLTKGQEGLLFLKKHHSENFYIMVHFDDLVDSKAADYKAGVDEAKKATKVLENPVKSLKVDSKEDRFTAVGMLLSRYRTAPIGTDPSKLKQEEIPAEESKLIMTALADADWTQQGGGPRGFQAGFTNPMICFGALGVTEKDGFKFDGQGNYQEVVKSWVKDNADKYRIKKFVPEEKK